MAIAAPFPAAGVRGRTGERSTPRSRTAPQRRTSPPRGSAAAARSGGELRLTRRGRLVAVAAAAVVLLAAITLSSGFRAEAGSSPADQGRATGVVVVQAGESLWQIAQAIAPETDPRETVTRIRDLNGLGDRPVRAGESLVVPVPTAPDLP